VEAGRGKKPGLGGAHHIRLSEGAVCACGVPRELNCTPLAGVAHVRASKRLKLICCAGAIRVSGLIT